MQFMLGNSGTKKNCSKGKTRHLFKVTVVHNSFEMTQHACFHLLKNNAPIEITMSFVNANLFLNITGKVNLFGLT